MDSIKTVSYLLSLALNRHIVRRSGWIQSRLYDDGDADEEIPRVRKEDMKETELSDIEYIGPKKPSIYAYIKSSKAKLVELLTYLKNKGETS